MQRIGVASLGFVILASACKLQSPETTVKTLDNFAAQKIVSVNSCSGSQVVRPQLAQRIIVNNVGCAQMSATSPDKAYCRDVEAYLTAVPTEVQDAFLAMGGSISVRADSNALCSSIMGDEKSPQYAPAAERQKLDSCFMFAQGKAGTAQAGKSVLTLVHSPDSQNIRHNGVRLFGFLYAQFVPRLSESVDTAGKKTFNFDAKLPLGSAFESYKSDLARNFFTDLYKLERSGGEARISNLAPMIGKDGAGQIIANLNAGKVDVFEGVTFAQGVGDSAASRQMRLQRVKDFIFAEAFDSLVCSDATRASADRDFKRTSDFFATLLPVIKERSRMLSSSQAANGVGMALAAPPSGDKLSLNGNTQYLLQMLMSLFQQRSDGAGFAGLGAAFNAMDPSILDAGGDYGAGDLLASCPGGNCSSGNCSFCNGGSCANCTGGNCSCAGGCGCGAYA